MMSLVTLWNETVSHLMCLIFPEIFVANKCSCFLRFLSYCFIFFVAVFCMFIIH